ncbi:MAG TPA: LysE family translocator [Candidatus Binatia bacterium]|nr:LysE family translocator [Candidatus Binatia bacterium]
MPEKAAFLTFLVAALALNIAPGPDMLYVIGRSVGQGRKAGIVSSLGVFVGCWVHILAAAFGIAALLRSSPLAFNVVRYAGAAYLIYLGIKMLAQKTNLASQQLKTESLGTIFRQGAITNMLNPKVAIFFLAFLPQFIDAHRGSVVLQIVVLGLIFNVGGTLVNLAVAYAGGTLGELLRRNQSIARLQRRFTGLIFVGLGLRLAWQKR